MLYKSDGEPRLPFPIKRIEVHGRMIEEYIIPEDKKAEVLDQMYLFEPVPSLDEERFDLHSGKLFRVRDFRVTREDDHNWLVSPYYEEGGGTMIDWMPAEWANEEADEDWEDEFELEDEGDDDNCGLVDIKKIPDGAEEIAMMPVLGKLKKYMKQQGDDGARSM